MKNYKYIGILVLAWLFTLPATAQLGEERHNFAVGINGGLNMNSVSFDPKIKQNTLNGMEMGVTMRYGSGNTYSRTMNYVEIPLLAHLAFGKDALNRGVKFFINAGPQIGFFLSDKEEMSDNWDTSQRPNGVTEQ